MTKSYTKDVTRIMSLFDVKTWHTGQSERLRELMGVGFFNHMFVSKNVVVTLYYDDNEREVFHKKLREILTEEFFNRLCEDFALLIEEANKVSSNEEIFELSSKMMPALMIFDEISNYPEIASEDILRRLERIRKSTEHVSYVLSKKANIINQPKNFILYHGEVFVKND